MFAEAETRELSAPCLPEGDDLIVERGVVSEFIGPLEAGHNPAVW